MNSSLPFCDGPGSLITEDLEDAFPRSGPCSLFGYSPSEPHRDHNEENDRRADASEVRSDLDGADWSTTPGGTESSEDDEDGTKHNAESKRIHKLFKKFSSRIQRKQRVTELDEEYGDTAVRTPASQWFPIEGNKLPRRVRLYIAHLSIANAQPCRLGVGPGSGANSDAHRWLIVTNRDEFVFDMLTMTAWTRPRDPSRRAAPPPRQPA